MVGIEEAGLNIDNKFYFLDTSRYETEFYNAKKAYLMHQISPKIEPDARINRLLQYFDYYKIDPQYVDFDKAKKITLDLMQRHNKLLNELKSEVQYYTNTMPTLDKRTITYKLMAKEKNELKADIFAMTFAYAESRLNIERFQAMYPTIMVSPKAVQEMQKY